MLHAKSPDISSTSHFLELPDFLETSKVVLKIEGMNLAGSIKNKAALAMVENAELRGTLKPGGHIIESSSGSLGVALAMIAAAKNYRFTCVVDPNISRVSLAAIRAFGAEVVHVEQPDANGGYLQGRLTAVRRRTEANPSIVWLNQYENPANPEAHRDGTAVEILEQFPQVDYLFIGVGTSGTLMGCVDHFRKHSPHTRIIAVDSVGSVTFGGSSQPRQIPGLGSSQKPPLFRRGCAEREIEISEHDAIRSCRTLARSYGYLAGGSTGSIVAGILEMRSEIDAGSLVMALSPDTGYRYLDTVYDDDWVRTYFDEEALAPLAPTTSMASAS
ncbi:2,3-diaminopropionate biosynthesis protein SbnA [Lipingzhangella sp. LS1_29]|uniref:2,3-diaminopropionate biosynthesis protein SbnA n=1 Tax=Lipingzhangella rawalii TaxID=2055835 RepID=A0ABU2H2S2_9ACTN|nr:2,3-diaminopropionate biosynthesis protein SbnA [Lipingzhangella rawalii]MDS1269608.1 2,3-diaminopropionate biosynthesis protein SbnA [Lipingzhangella rawalii]